MHTHKKKQMLTLTTSQKNESEILTIDRKHRKCRPLRVNYIY